MPKYKIKTPNKPVVFIARCVLCDKAIMNNETYAILHGRFYFCKNEELAKLTLEQEKDLVAKGKFEPLRNLTVGPK